MAIYDYDIEYNGETGKSQGVILAGFPVFEEMKGTYDEYPIPGRVGSLINHSGRRNNIRVNCELLAISDDVHLLFRRMKKWFGKAGKLRFTDNTDAYYEVLAIASLGSEREFRRCGRIRVQFVIFPYEFLNSGNEEYNSITYNPYCVCMPTYIVEGSGTCVITANGRTFTANVPGKLTIDSRRMISYKSDGSSGNTLVNGNYEDLWIEEGDVNLSCTSGFTLKIVPKWGYWA